MPEALPRAAEPEYLTDALRRAGALGTGRVLDVVVESSKATILSRIVRLRETGRGPRRSRSGSRRLGNRRFAGNSFLLPGSANGLDREPIRCEPPLTNPICPRDPGHRSTEHRRSSCACGEPNVTPNLRPRTKPERGEEASGGHR